MISATRTNELTAVEGSAETRPCPVVRRRSILQSGALAIVASVLLLSAPANVRAEMRIDLIGAWGGSVDAVAIEQVGPQTLAYVGSGVRMLVLDVTDPGNLVELGSVILGGLVGGIQVRDGYAFVATGQPAFFCIVDVSDPAAPVLLSSGNKWGTNGNFGNLRLHGDWAYAVGANNVLQGFDISDPENVPPGQRCTGVINDIVFAGNYAYSAIPGYVVDFDFSASPCPEGGMFWVYIPELDGASIDSIKIALNGNYAYVTAANCTPCQSRIFVVDVSDPEAPVHVGTWGDGPGEDLELSKALAVSNGRLYVVDWKNDGGEDGTPHRALIIFDIATDPTSPALLGEYWSVGAATELTVVGTTVYLQEEREGLVILDASDPANITRVGGWHSPAVFHQGALDGDTLYVTDRRFGVSVLDVSSPIAPQLLGKHETGGTQNWGLATRDDKLYVAAGYAGLQVLDVSTPATPLLLGQFPFAGPHGIGLALYSDDVFGLIALVQTSPGAFLVNFAVDDPQNITDVGSVFIGGGSVREGNISLNQADGIAHVASGGPVAVDVSNPANPFVMGYADAYSKGIWLEGNVLYAASDANNPGKGLTIIDVSNPYAQTQMAFFETPSQDGYSVSVQSQRAYLGSENAAFRVFDVSDPTAPALLLHDESGPVPFPTDVILDGPVVYVVTSRAIGAGVLTYLIYEPGDFDADRDWDLADFAAFQQCFGGDGLAPGEATCVIGDFDEDNDVDEIDFAAFEQSFTGTQ